MLITSVGCSNDETTTDSTTTPAEGDTTTTTEEATDEPSVEPVEIRAAWWGDTNRHALYQQILDAFVEEFDHVPVAPEPTSWNDYWDKLQTQSAGGNAPDFMGMHPQFAADYIRRNVLEPLDPYIDDGVISTDGWTDGTLETGVLDGVNYMMAMGVTFSCNFVNLGLIEELGLESPPFDWSWDDMMEWGLEAREALDAAGMTGTFAVNDDSSNLNSWRYFVRNQGREIYTQDGEIGFLPEDAEKYWTLYNEFRDNKIVPDPATTTEYFGATLEDSLFSHDRALIVRVPVNQYKLYRTTFPDKEVGIIRNQTAGTYGTAVGEFPEGAHFAVSANASENEKLAAAQLMNFWINTEEGLSIFGLDQGVPGNLDLASAYESNLDEYQLEIQKFVSTLSSLATPSTFPASGASEVDATFRLLGDEVAFGVKTPAEAAEELYDQAIAIIERARG